MVRAKRLLSPQELTYIDRNISSRIHPDLDEADTNERQVFAEEQVGRYLLTHLHDSRRTDPDYESRQ